VLLFPDGAAREVPGRNPGRQASFGGATAGTADTYKVSFGVVNVESTAMQRLQALAREGEKLDLDSIADQLEACHAKVEQLEVAVEHRTVIGIAIGILVERLEISVDTAFAALKRVSQEKNRRIYDIAVELAQTGHAAGF
jgi:hypothetical protein